MIIGAQYDRGFQTAQNPPGYDAKLHSTLHDDDYGHTQCPSFWDMSANRHVAQQVAIIGADLQQL